MSKQIGFIGAGNMGKAIIAGIIASGQVAAGDIHVFDLQQSQVDDLVARFGVRGAASAAEVAAQADILFAAVKPNVITQVLADLAPRLKTGAILVSIAAGVTLASLAAAVGAERKVVRVMPNTPALVNAGMSSLTANANVNAAEIAEVVALLESFGRAEVVPESLIHAVTAVSGSAPAYVFMFIEAMADAAVLGGMPRAQAYQFAAQTVLGSAKMVLESGQHPGALKDMVCSPGGTTIEAVKVLEEKGLRAGVMEAMLQCMRKSEAMSQRK